MILLSIMSMTIFLHGLRSTVWASGNHHCLGSINFRISVKILPDLIATFHFCMAVQHYCLSTIKIECVNLGKCLLRSLLCGILLLQLVFQVGTHPFPASKGVQQEAFAIKAKVDLRAELMSIISRLAGYQEY